MSAPDRNETELRRMLQERGLSDGCLNSTGELATMKRLIQEHPAYSDAKHPEHKAVTGYAARVYAEEFPDQPEGS